MTPEPKPLNVPLILFTLVFIVFFGTLNQYVEQPRYTPLQACGIAILALLFAPIGVVWARALWNTLIPRITGWKEISFWEAAGLVAVLAILH